MNFSSDSAEAQHAVLPALTGAVDALSAVPGGAGIRGLSDTELLEAGELLANCRDLISSKTAALAGEVARRSASELGSLGLAQRAGYRTPEQFVKVTTRASGPEAVRAVRLGVMMNEAAEGGRVDDRTGEIVVAAEPWLAEVASRLARGLLSSAAADAIRAGLGKPNSAVTPEQLAEAVRVLCDEAVTIDPDRLLKSARALRDSLDAEGIAVREEERREARSLRLFDLPNGLTRAVWDMDPETAVIVRGVFDRATSPKFGGVRFVSGDVKETSDRIFADARTPVQLASDAFVQLLRAGADADSSMLLGTGAPSISVLTTAEALNSGNGHGYFEGRTEAISLATISRQLCDGSVTTIAFDSYGTPLDASRENRLFSKRQKLALAATFGGCMFGNCERPPSWCEAHHVEQYARDNGKTEVANGILLCKHHHLLLHNNGWEIRRDEGGTYWLTPPADLDSSQTPREMPTKSAALKLLASKPVGR
jgi:hypothetical protein